MAELQEITPRILVVDDQPYFRSGLRAILQLHGRTVVGEAQNGEQALELAPRLRPNLIVMDLQMPGMGGVEAIRRLPRVWNQAAVLALTTFSDDALVAQALRAGACGYLLKDCPEDELFAAIAAALRGEAYLPAAIAGKVLRELRRSPPPAPTSPATEPLSPRETEIVRLLAAGATNKEIAATLFIADGTVRNHVSAILSKLGVRDRTQAALAAVHLGLL